jgi:hypothetical protein
MNRSLPDIPRTLAIVILLTVAGMVQAVHAQRPAALSPILVEPYDGRDVTDEQIVWSWFMQSSAGNGEEILCDLAVVEIIEGQTAEEAMRLNPPVILRQNLTTSTWGTSPFARALGHGRRYTWQITAKTRRGATFRIVSQSELWEFTYNDPAVMAEQIGETGKAPTTTPPDDHPGNDSNGVTLNDTLRPSGLGATPPADAERDQRDSGVAAAPRPIEVSGSARYMFASENRRGNL